MAVSKVNREVAAEFARLIGGHVGSALIYDSGVLEIYTLLGQKCYVSHGVVHTRVTPMLSLDCPKRAIPDCEIYKETICHEGCGCGCLLDFGFKRSGDPEDAAPGSTHCNPWK